MTATYERQTPKRIFLHWTAGNYTQVFSDYHTSITAPRSLRHLGKRVAKLVRTHPYDKALHHHTYKANTNAVAISTCSNAPGCPPLPDQVELMCKEVAYLSIDFGIPIDTYHCQTHAESALEIGYYPERIDYDGRGDELRSKARWYKDKILRAGYKPGGKRPV